MPGLPSGTVTFLFTDIEGSTRLLEEHGDAYAGLLEEHCRVLRDAVDRHQGVEVDTQGDAFFVAFTRASDALEAAEEAQRELEIPVRMGIHTGEPAVTEEGYVGMDVHRGARVCTAIEGEEERSSVGQWESQREGFQARLAGRWKATTSKPAARRAGPSRWTPG